jgi:MerR family mercuric resistance operon transcriptional regulator
VAAITTSRGAEITIGELARITGVNIETIRYYERLGLLPKSVRTEHGHRRFGEEHAKRLIFIRHARELGFSQDEVRDLIKLSDGGFETCAQVKALAEGHLAGIRDKIARLRRLERILSDAATRCLTGEKPMCPVIETISRRDFNALPHSGGGRSAPRSRSAG